MHNVVKEKWERNFRWNSEKKRKEVGFNFNAMSTVYGRISWKERS